MRRQFTIELKMLKLTAILLAFCLAIDGAVIPQCNPAWSKPTTRNVYDLKNVYQTPDTKDKTSTDTLRLVHVVLRHGDRAADPDALYPLDPHYNHTYYPYGLGQLSNLGKKQEFGIGKALRKRYNDFLGDIYTPDVMDARSTDVNRTKMSLELAMAGLWPPAKDQTWNDELPWLAIPYNYWRADEDRVLGDPNVVCPRFKKLYDQNLLTEENQNENEKLKPFYEYISRHMGLNFTHPIDVYNIYFTLRSEEGFGLELPEWTKCVWPEKFLEVALKQYDLFTQTHELTGLSAGLLLDKIIKDSSFRMSNSSTAAKRKIYLYSGHERNIALTLIGLGVYFPHMPPYASYVLLELHEVDGVYGFKVFYQDYSGDEPKLMTLPGCEGFCEFHKFYKIVYPNLPSKSCDL